MNNERLNGLHRYLDALILLQANEYRCTNEIAECITLIKAEFSTESEYNIGDRIECNWAGGNKTGTVVDTNVKYNNAIEFTKEHYEPACVIRFDKGMHDVKGNYLGLHAVIPYREISRVKANNRIT